MFVQEMHIALDLEVNKLNSNLYDIILPQEKDYFLNRAQDRKVKQYYSPLSNPKGKGFEMSQKRIDDLRNLLVPNYYDKAYLLDSTDFDFDTKLRFFFPDDYMFLTSQRSKVFYNDCSNISIATSTLDVNYFVIEVPNIESYLDFKLKSSIDVLYIDGIDLSQNDKSLFLEYVVNKWNTSFSSTLGWTFYIERYKDIESIGNIIAVKDTNVAASLKYTFNDSSYTTFSTTTKIYSYYTGTNGKEGVFPNRFAQQDDIYVMQIDPFNKTEANTPLTIINNNFIDVFIDKPSFFVKEIAISYIRTPKTISLILNQSCELSEKMHEEIVRDAANLLLEDLEARGRLETSERVELTNE